MLHFDGGGNVRCVNFGRTLSKRALFCFCSGTRVSSHLIVVATFSSVSDIWFFVYFIFLTNKFFKTDLLFYSWAAWIKMR